MKKVLLCLILLSPFILKAQLTWKLVDTTIDLNYSLASTDAGYVFACNNGKLYRSTQNGDSGTFQQLMNTPQVGIFSQVFAYGGNLYLLNKGSANNKGVWRSTDNGINWTQSTKGFATADIGHLEGVIFIDSGCIIIQAYDGVQPKKYYVSTDDGATWTSALTVTYTGGLVTSVLRKNGRLYLFHHTKLYISNDNGKSWAGPSLSYYPSTISYRAVVLSNGTFIMKSSALVMRSTNSGASWKQVTATGIKSSSARTSDFFKSPHSDTLYLTSSTGSSLEILMSADSGITWQKFDNGLPPFATADRFFYNQQLLLSKNGYMFVAPDKGGIYRTSETVTKPFKDPKRQEPTDTSTSVQTVHNESGVRLYPNPVTGMLHVSFEKEFTGIAGVSVYDMVGRNVTSAIADGSTQKVWKLDVHFLPPGTYIVNISLPEGSIVRRFEKQ